MLKRSKQSPKDFSVLRMVEPLEYDQQVVLDPPWIFSVGFKKSFERINAILGTNQMDNTKIFHWLAYESLCNRYCVVAWIDLLVNVKYRMERPLHYWHRNRRVRARRRL